MPSPCSVFPGEKRGKSFEDFHAKWSNTLKTTLFPLLQQSLSSTSSTLLSSRVDLILHHLLSYYNALDLAAISSPSTSLAHLLFPSWRSPLEIPFLFLGDLHPYLFTNLLRSFLDQEKDVSDVGCCQSDESSDFFDRPRQVLAAWNDPSSLVPRIERIECGLRLMVPALVDRARKAQAGFVGMVAEKWVDCEGKKRKMRVAELVETEMEEMLSVFVDANRLRRSVIMEIMAATSVQQGALFLEGLTQFLVGFNSPINNRGHFSF